MPTPPDEPEVVRWATVSRGERVDYRVFSLQQVERRSPRTGHVATFQVLHTPAWVNVVALTPDDEVVLVRQYRHGLDAITLEVPGGLADDGETQLQAGVRELLEETGYAGDSATVIGLVHPNPAIQTNSCATVLVRDVRLVGPPRPDDDEHIAVELVPLADVPRLIREGAITHSLVLCAFQHLWMLDTTA